MGWEGEGKRSGKLDSEEDERRGKTSGEGARETRGE